MQFKDVVGHDTLKKQLIQEVNEDRISHAQLFLGKTGYGNLALTLSFVQYIFCEQRSSADSCGACPSCRKISALQHPDVHFSFPTVQALSKTSDAQFTEWKSLFQEEPYFSLNDWITTSDPKGRKPILSVHQSQEIIKKLTLKSFEGNYKVSIIWMAEEMNLACANKLLKIIEEPPAKTLFILIAENQEVILPTILSRTQLVKIKPISDVDMHQYIGGIGVRDKELQKSIVARAEGNARLAKELSSGEKLNNQNRTDFIQLMRICYKKEVLPMMDWAEKMSTYGREEQKNFLLYALYMIRQSLMKNYTDKQLMRTSTEEEEFLDRFSRFITNNNVQDFTSLFNDAHYYLERNAHAKLLFTNITFEVMRYIHRA